MNHSQDRIGSPVRRLGTAFNEAQTIKERIMGIDACIYFKSKTTPQRMERSLPDGYTIQVASECDYIPKDATHYIHTYERYYGVGYEGGSWPDICAVLMLLMNSPDIDDVWYCGDHENGQILRPIIEDDIINLTSHFISYGERPYRGDWPSTATDDRTPSGAPDNQLVGQHLTEDNQK